MKACAVMKRGGALKDAAIDQGTAIDLGHGYGYAGVGGLPMFAPLSGFGRGRRIALDEAPASHETSVCLHRERMAPATRTYRSLLAALALMLALLAVTACGLPGTRASAGPITPTATATAKIANYGQTADQILAGLKARGLPIGASVTYTASTDVNSLLGRPGQYIGKINFKDTRVTDSGDQGVNIDVNDGGTRIEVFATLTDATNRTKYVQAIATGASLFAEYDYQDGLVLLRLSKQLTPDQAQAYLAALRTLP